MSDHYSADHYGQTVLRVSRQYDAQLKPLGDLALARLGARAGERVIDVGCGAAQTCLQLAEAVGPSGSVLGIDLSTVLAAHAAERVHGTPNIRIVRGDAGTVELAPGYHDALFSRFGVMAFADPVATFAHLRRALTPKGRLAFVCWRGLRENELDYLPFDAAAGRLPADEVRQAQAASPFSFAEAARIRAVLTAAGFGNVETTAHDVSVSAGNLEDTLELCLSAGALGSLIRRKPELRERVAAPVREALAAKESGGIVWMKAAVWVVSGRVA